MKSPRAQLLVDWLEHRTGIVRFTHELLYENVPGGARWRYVWGNTLVFAFFMQMVTGVCLWMNYSPGSQSAWESVFYIQYQLQGGWLLRGLHHYMAQAMIVLLVIHLVQVVVDGAYRAPREFNFWIGLILLKLILAMGLTGYLLPWDQRGYRATAVATNLMGIVPVVGPAIQRMVIGGSEFGNLTLTRFFALHAGLLPGLLVFFLVLHIYMFRRHGLKHKTPLRSRDNYLWPDQVLKNFIACAAVLVGVLVLVFHSAVTSDRQLDLSHPGRLGAELGAPADPSHQFAAARPEWYFLFLFQLLKYFPGERELWGAIVLPGAIFALLALMPIVGRSLWGHRFNVAALFGLLAAVATLTTIALHADYFGPASGEFRLAVADAKAESERAAELALAPEGIPPAGAISLMRNDPKVEGRRLYAQQHCDSCHDKPAPTGEVGQNALDAAPSLVDFASRAWIAGLLNPKKVAGPDYFGRTAHHAGDMVEFVQGDLPKWSPKDVENVVMALSAEAQLRSQAKQDAADAERIAAGRALLAAEDRCGQCHKFHDANTSAEAPDLTGYGSREWLIGMISNPADKRFYGERNDRMPAFAEHPNGSPHNRLSPAQVGILADWLRHDWYMPAGEELNDQNP